jgi:hypothetical protein
VIGRLIAPAARVRNPHLRGERTHSSFVPSLFRPNLESLSDRVVPSSGSIAGQVFEDLTGNGLTADDTALGGVRVHLVRDANGDGVRSWGDWRVATSETRDDGSYSFSCLREGTYFVVEKASGRLVRTGPALDDNHTVTLGAGEQVEGQDFAFFRKVPRWAMSDFRFTVISPDGTERSVRNLRGNTNAGDTVVAHFRIAGCADPVVVSLVSYTAPGPHFDPHTAGQQSIFQTASDTFGPGCHSLTVQIPNDNYQVDFVLGPAIDRFGPAGSKIFYSPQCRLLSADNDGPIQTNTGSIAGSVFVDRNQDSVLDPAAGEFALGGVQVDLYATDANGGSTFVRSVLTSSDGSYRFTGLADGTYSLVEQQPAGRPDGGDYLGSAGGDGTLSDTFSGIVLATGQQATGYVFTELAGSAGLSGRACVPDESEASGHRGLEGVVIVLSYTEVDGSLVTLTAVTDVDGFYWFDALAAGTYTLSQQVPDGYAALTPVVGTVDGVNPEGEILDESTVTGIDLGPEQFGMDYLFRNVLA